MSDILEEVFTDQSEERKIYFLRKLLSLAIILTVIIVAAMIIYNFKEQRNIKYNQEISSALLKIISNNQLGHSAAVESLDTISKISQNDELTGLSLIKKAQMLIKHRDVTAAKLTLEQVVRNNDYASLSRAYARLMWLGLFVDNTKPSELDEVTSLEYFSYFANEDVPLYGAAHLIKSAWQIKIGELDMASQTLDKIISSSVPISIKEQARALLSNIENKKGT